MNEKHKNILSYLMAIILGIFILILGFYLYDNFSSQRSTANAKIWGTIAIFIVMGPIIIIAKIYEIIKNKKKK